jgi:hypothetical protein
LILAERLTRQAPNLVFPRTSTALHNLFRPPHASEEK